MSHDPVAVLLDEIQEEYDRMDLAALTEEDVQLILAAVRYVNRSQGRSTPPRLTLYRGGLAGAR